MPETFPNLPQPYFEDPAVEGIRSRVIQLATDIFLLKDNPFIDPNLSQEERAALNEKLAKPFPNEICVDKDNYFWICRYMEDTTGQTVFKYFSKEKETSERLAYYESVGVLNQLMSAYNNGRIYNFYFDTGTNTLHPNSDLVFPENYKYYTVRKMELNSSNKPIYVAGVISDNTLVDTYVGMKTIKDSQNNTMYTKMGTCKIFTISDPDGKQCDTLRSDNFYIVEFYNTEKIIVDTKMFQAIDAVMLNDGPISPSQQVVDLRISILRHGFPQSGVEGIYPLLIGEEIENLNFEIVAVYGDGSAKVITQYLDTGRLSIIGLDKINTSAAPGTKFDVTAVYFPNVDGSGTPIGSSKEKTIMFQIISNKSKKIVKVIPSIWKYQSSVGGGLSAYKLKVFAMTDEGIVENRTKAFYDTVKVIASGTTEEPIPENMNYYYNIYDQSVIFNPKDESIDSLRFKFKIFSESKEVNVEFVAKFNNPDGNIVSAIVDGTPNPLLGTLGTTVKNKTVLNRGNSEQVNFKITLEAGASFEGLYARIINGEYISPQNIEIYAIKDTNMLRLSKPTEVVGTSNNITVYCKNDNISSAIIANLNAFDYIFVKFLNAEKTVCVNMDTFKVSV